MKQFLTWCAVILLFGGVVVTVVMPFLSFMDCSGPAPRQTTTTTTVEMRKDSAAVKIPSINIDSLKAELSAETTRRVLLESEAAQWRDFYLNLLQGMQPGEEQTIPVVKLDRRFSSFQVYGEHIVEYRDTLRAEYWFPPVNEWRNVHVGIQQRKVVYEYPVVTTTTTDEGRIPLVKGVLLGGSIAGSWRDSFYDLTSKRIEFFAGITFQTSDFQFDVLPLNVEITQAQAEMWFKLEGRWYP